MTPFFQEPSDWNRLIQEARRWIGTPFLHHAALRKRGVDCVNLWAEIYKAVGVSKSIILPDYSMGAGNALEDSQLESFITALGWMQEVSIEDPLPGDILTFRFGRVAHHVGGRVWGRKFIHSIKGHGVIESSLEELRFGNRLQRAFRAMKVDA